MNDWSRCLSPRQLEEVLADPGRLSEADLRAFEYHTENCQGCREILEQIICDSELQAWRDLLSSDRSASARSTSSGLSSDADRPAVRAAFPFPVSTRAGFLGQLGPYCIERQLGSGAMGVVFLAYDIETGRKVAIKVPRLELAPRKHFRARFEREAQSAATVNDEHVVTTYHVGSTADFPLPYLVMQFVDGETLADRLERETSLPPREAVEIARQVAAGLAAAHAQGRVHRDIKPSNIMLEKPTSRVKITDFGLARALDGSEQISASGAAVGTPSYMSPEQILPPYRADTRSDVFGLGVVLYEMLTGERPFRGTTPPVVMQQVVNEEPISPRKFSHAINRDLETVTLKCLAKEPGRRYQTAQELADDLQRWLNHEPIWARPVGLAGRLSRWCRRKPAKATAFGLAAIVLIALAAVPTAFALYQGRVAEQISQEQHKTEAALHDSRLQSATLAFQRGLDLCEKGEVGPGMHWLVRSLELAPEGEDDLRRVIRVNLAGWRSRLVPLRAYLPHQATVTQVAFSSDGRRFLTRSDDNMVQVWEAATARRVAALRHEHPVTATAFSPDGTRILTGSTAGTIHLWDVASGQQCLSPPRYHRQTVWAVTFSPDGQTFLTAGEDRTAWLWDMATGQPRFEQLSGHKDAIVSAAFSPDGKKVLTGSWDGTARLWDAATGKERPGSPLKHGSKVAIYGAAFSPNGTLVVTWGDDRTAQLWLADSGKPLHPPLRHHREVVAVAFSPDSHVIATASKDYTAQLWATDTGRPLGDLLLHPGQVNTAAFSPKAENPTVVTGGTDNNARVWAAVGPNVWSVVATRKPVGALLPHQGEITSVAFSPDGQSLLTGSTDQIARLWEAPSAKPLGLSLQNQSPINALAFTPDGRTAVTGAVGQPDFWDVASGQPLDLVGQPINLLPKLLFTRISKNVSDVLNLHSGGIDALRISPDGRTILTGGSDGTARFWDRLTGRCRILSPAHQQPVWAVALDGQTAVTASADGTARLWDAATAQPRGLQLPHDGEVAAVALSPDGQTVVTGSFDHKVRLWDTTTAKERASSPLPHRDKVLAVAYDPAGKIVVTGCQDGTAQLWNAATGQPIGEPLPHGGPVRSVAFSPNGKRILTGSQDKTARLWDAATGRPVGPPLQHQHWVRCVTFSPDGATILTGSEDLTARLWDAATGLPSGPPIEHQGAIYAIAYSPDGRKILTGSYDHVARISDVPTAVEGETEQLVLWVQVLTGIELDSDGGIHSLDASAWEERRSRWARYVGKQGEGDGHSSP